ncbi:MAG: tRNA (N6-threonylcarbamoyladenosine(37)-N6)-methyltransferase TrmO [Candidatus Aminicenantes bacterium]|nr:tRNA (N6-threonylcarbamoyladenosine(37)-N6)-methyltransferase TrmO [Candidatus Aminicenantes bacterium]
MEIKLRPIGVVHSPFKTNEDIETERFADPQGFDSVEGDLEIFEEYEAGLKDTEGFSHLIIIFAFHESEGYRLHTKPFLDDQLRGLFSTRSPNRPNPIGLTVVKVVERKGNRLRVKGIDMIEGTPILEIKPYTPRDQKPSIKFGWLEDKMKKK